MFRRKLPLTVFFIAALTGLSYASLLLDRVIAVVNQDVITWSELYRTMESDAAPQLKGLKDEERKKFLKDNEAAFLETLINIKLQLQEAKNSGIITTDEELNEAIGNIMKKYSMNDASFKESLKKEGYTYEEYRKRLREQILIGKVVNQQIRSKIVVTDGDVKTFLEENSDMAEIGGGYRISQIFFKKSENDKEKEKLEEKAAIVIKKLKAGESFQELAKKYSEDPSGNAGGDLGLIKKGDLLREFSEAVSKIKPGEVSMPFWTERGLHIIRLEEKVEAKDQAEIKEEAGKRVYDKFFTEKYNAWIKALREKAYIEIRL